MSGDPNSAWLQLARSFNDRTKAYTLVPSKSVLANEYFQQKAATLQKHVDDRNTSALWSAWTSGRSVSPMPAAAAASGSVAEDSQRWLVYTLIFSNF